MRGASKEMPWPGARCGWIEVYNADKDPMFKRYINSILNAKMMEVCSTTLLQLVYPKLINHPEYPRYLDERIRRYERFSGIAHEALKDIDGVLVNRINGASMSVCFEDGVLNDKQSLEIENAEVRTMIEDLIFPAGTALDKRFVYYLLAATGICVVPLTSFASEINGFRVTLLERDEAAFTRIFQTLAGAIRTYLKSGFWEMMAKRGDIDVGCTYVCAFDWANNTQVRPYIMSLILRNFLHIQQVGIITMFGSYFLGCKMVATILLL